MAKLPRNEAMIRQPLDSALATARPPRNESVVKKLESQLRKSQLKLKSKENKSQLLPSSEAVPAWDSPGKPFVELPPPLALHRLPSDSPRITQPPEPALTPLQKDSALVKLPTPRDTALTRQPLDPTLARPRPPREVAPARQPIKYSVSAQTSADVSTQTLVSMPVTPIRKPSVRNNQPLSPSATQIQPAGSILPRGIGPARQVNSLPADSFTVLHPLSLLRLLYGNSTGLHKVRARRQLMARGWRYHMKYNTWFVKKAPSVDVTCAYARGQFYYYNKVGMKIGHINDFIFEYIYMVAVDADISATYCTRNPERSVCLFTQPYADLSNAYVRSPNSN